MTTLIFPDHVTHAECTRRIAASHGFAAHLWAYWYDSDTQRTYCTIALDNDTYPCGDCGGDDDTRCGCN